ncbi:MAG TPA: hypothetical protein PKG59_20205 [Spirochaetota bacterium]|nr:hypothetical protein [Spirochaetota bacterium]
MDNKFIVFIDLVSSTSYKMKNYNNWLDRQLFFLETIIDTITSPLPKGEKLSVEYYKTLGDGILISISENYMSIKLIHGFFNFLTDIFYQHNIDKNDNIIYRAAVDYGLIHIPFKNSKDPLGLVVDRCSRILSSCQENQILVSEDAYNIYKSFYWSLDWQKILIDVKSFGELNVYEMWQAITLRKSIWSKKFQFLKGNFENIIIEYFENHEKYPCINNLPDKSLIGLNEYYILVDANELLKKSILHQNDNFPDNNDDLTKYSLVFLILKYLHSVQIISGYYWNGVYSTKLKLIL